MVPPPSLVGRIYRRRNRRGKILRDWYVRVRLDGKEVTLRGGPTKKAAREKLRELLEEVQRQERGKAGHPDEINFEDFVEIYLASVKANRSPTTYRSVNTQIRNVVLPAFRGRVVADISKTDLARFVAAREGGISVATRNRDISLLSSLFGKAVELGYASENPASGLSRAKEAERPVPYLDASDQDRLIAKCPDLIRPLVSLALDTGMRQGELLALEWRDVHLDRNVVVVRASKNRKSREVPLPRRGTDTLETIRRDRFGGSPPPTERVFTWIPRPWPGHHDRMFRKAVKDAELPPLRFHDLRHLYAVSMVRAGVPLPDVGKLLGHKTIAMTLRYSHHAPQDAGQRALDLLDEWRKGKGRPDDVAESTPRYGEEDPGADAICVPPCVPPTAVVSCPVAS